MPPLRRLVRLQLIVVLILGVVASAVAGVKYARLDESLGIGTYRVTLKMRESGGLYSASQVTYRGVAVGRVQDMRVTGDGVDVDVVLDSGRDIPASAVAVVANRSAIGEQFVDLRPTTSAGPYLAAGSVISKIEYPPKLDEVTRAAIDLTKTVPVDDLHTVVTELGRAFNGTGDDLTRLIDSLDKLSKTGLENLDETISLIRNANPVLATQADQSDEILSWSKDLDVVAATLASADPAVRRILTNGPRAASSLSTFIRDNGGDATKLLGQVGGTLRTIAPAEYATGMTLWMLSVLSAGSHSVASTDGSIRFGIVLETENPPACRAGYEGTQRMIDEMKRRNPDFDVSMDDFPFNTDAACRVPTGSPIAVRGANNVGLSNPNVDQPWDNKPKKDPDKLNLNPLANQLAALMGVRAR